MAGPSPQAPTAVEPTGPEAPWPIRSPLSPRRGLADRSVLSAADAALGEELWASAGERPAPGNSASGENAPEPSSPPTCRQLLEQLLSRPGG